MKIRKTIYNKIINLCPVVPPETGGIIGQQNGIIGFAEFDSGTVQSDCAVYIPNVEKLNSVIEKWKRSGIEFVGMFHCHPIGQETLSKGDIEYIHSVFDSMPDSVTELYFPIVIPKSHIVAYKAIRKNHRIIIEKDNIVTKE